MADQETALFPHGDIKKNNNQKLDKITLYELWKTK